MTNLILGGAGRTGHRVISRLRSKSLPVRAASRRSGFDWDDDSTWASAPRLLTFADIAEELGRVSGREIVFEPVDKETFVADVAADGIPPEEAEPLADLFAEVLDGRNASTTDGVQRAIGREPSDFQVYAKRTAATGIWS